MALLGTEKMINGVVVDISTFAVVVTYTTVSAVTWGGFLRDPDGRLVVVDG